MSGPLTPPSRPQQPSLAALGMTGQVAIDTPRVVAAPATISAALTAQATNDTTQLMSRLGLPLPLPHAASAQQLQAALSQLDDGSHTGFDLQAAIAAAALPTPGLLSADALAAMPPGALKPICFALGAQALAAARPGGEALRAAAAQAIQQLLLLGTLMAGAEAARAQPGAF